jgi:hypothetical protein
MNVPRTRRYRLTSISLNRKQFRDLETIRKKWELPSTTETGRRLIYREMKFGEPKGTR